MKKIILVATLLVNAAILFYACKKDKETEEPVDFDTVTSQDNSLAESTFNDVNNIVNEAITRGDSGLSTYRVIDEQNSLLSACATVTVTPNVPPATGGNIVVDFTQTPCLCSDNRYRQGKININYTGPYRDSGTVITTTFTTFLVGKDTVNMFQVSGTKTVTNKGRNPAGNFNFDISVNGQLIDKNNNTMTWNSNRNREWTAGYSTQYTWSDDVYKISGSSSGTNFEGNSFTSTITTPLTVDRNCRWITQGKFELVPTGKATRYFDYGSGTCDANATVTVNGKTIPITLR